MELNLNMFRLILEKAGEEFFLVRPDGQLVYVNEAAAKSLGYSVEEMLEMSVPDFDPFLGPAFNEHFEELKLGDVAPFQTEYIAKDGRLVLKEIKSVYLEIDSDEYVCAFARDITQRVLLEEKIRSSEEKYRRLIENLKEEYFFYSHDLNGIFTYLSPSITNVLGYFPDEFLAHYTEYLTDNPINDEVVRHTELSIQGKKQPCYEVEVFHKDSRVIRLKVIEEPIFDQEGKVIAVEGIAQDITDSRRLFKEMTMKTRELQEVNAAMKILLNQSEEAKKELEENILSNLKSLILPYLKELEIRLTKGREAVYLNIIKKNIEKITSSFSKNLSLISADLTPREIEVADFVRSGKANKEIAELLTLSPRTVETYRENLRAKLDIKNKKVNLRSYLLSLT